MERTGQIIKIKGKYRTFYSKYRKYRMAERSDIVLHKSDTIWFSETDLDSRVALGGILDGNLRLKPSIIWSYF